MRFGSAKAMTDPTQVPLEKGMLHEAAPKQGALSWVGITFPTLSSLTDLRQSGL